MAVADGDRPVEEELRDVFERAADTIRRAREACSEAAETRLRVQDQRESPPVRLPETEQTDRTDL